MDSFWGYSGTTGTILFIMVCVIIITPFIITPILINIAGTLKKINKNLNTNTAESNSSEAEDNYTTNNQRTRDLMKSLFNDEKNTSDR